ncbi:MAG: hypothetical protein HYY44_02725 [Deltaproteobacteria bacterium]|nr:hypothetical protein [Deltaproteobacteria bacterium]
MSKSLGLLFLFGILSITRIGFAVDGGYDRGFYLLSDDKNFRFKFNIQIQPRHEYVSKEAALDVNTFGLSRMRTYFTGHSFSPKFKYALTVEFNKGAGIRDGLVDLNLADYFKIRAGRYYIPINREDSYSATGMQLIDVSIVSYHFGVNRDYGLQFSGNIVKPVTYYVFVANGGGNDPAGAGGNQNKEMLVGTRLEVVPIGSIPGYQGDYDMSETPNVGLGGTILYDMGADQETEGFKELTEQQIDPLEDKLLRGDLDGSFAWHGFSFMGQWQFAYNTVFRTVDQGVMGQTGLFILPKKLEIAGRWSTVLPDFPFPALAQTGITKTGSEIGTGIPVHEVVGGINLYFKGHDLKLQMDYSQIFNVNGVRNINDQKVRTQLTFVF